MSDGLDGVEVGSDPDLSSQEKEVTFHALNRDDKARMHSDVPTVTRYLLKHPEVDVVNRNIKDGRIVSVQADVPLGLLKLQKKRRKSDNWSSVTGSV